MQLATAPPTRTVTGVAATPRASACSRHPMEQFSTTGGGHLGSADPSRTGPLDRTGLSRRSVKAVTPLASTMPAKCALAVISLDVYIDRLEGGPIIREAATVMRSIKRGRRYSVAPDDHILVKATNGFQTRLPSATRRTSSEVNFRPTPYSTSKASAPMAERRRWQSISRNPPSNGSTVSPRTEKASSAAPWS